MTHKNAMTSCEKDHGKKEKAVYFRTPHGTFSLFFEQGTPHYHFALSLESSVAGLVWKR